MHDEEMLDAAKAGDRERIRSLLNADPSLASVRLASGETPVMAALYRGHEAASQELADAALRANQRLDVFAAAALGRGPDLTSALSAGPVVNTFAYDGWTPLHLAAFFGRREAVEQLLSSGADLSTVSRNSLTNTPLHAAVAGGHVEVSLLLIERGTRRCISRPRPATCRSSRPCWRRAPIRTPSTWKTRRRCRARSRASTRRLST
jgi:uncharacterized protein